MNHKRIRSCSFELCLRHDVKHITKIGIDYIDIDDYGPFIRSATAWVPNRFGYRDELVSHLKDFAIGFDRRFYDCATERNASEKVPSFVKKLKENRDILSDFLSDIMSYLKDLRSLDVLEDSKARNKVIAYFDGRAEFILQRDWYPKEYLSLFRAVELIVKHYNETGDLKGCTLVANSIMSMARIVDLCRPGRRQFRKHRKDQLKIMRGEGQIFEEAKNDDYRDFPHGDEFRKQFAILKDKVNLISKMTLGEIREHNLTLDFELLRDLIDLKRFYTREASRSYELRDDYISTSSTGVKLKCPDGSVLRLDGVQAKIFAHKDFISDNQIYNDFIKSIEDLNRMVSTLDNFEYVSVSELHRLGYSVNAPLASGVGILQNKYKVRDIGLANEILQRPLAYIHNIVYKGMKDVLRADCTADQSKGVKFLRDLTQQDQIWHASFDLEKCTDTMDVRFQRDVLEFLVFEDRPEICDKWLHLMKTPLFMTDLGEYQSFRNGDPQGFLTSFPVFALTHHIMIYIAYMIANEDDSRPYRDRYRILGDDVISSFTSSKMIQAYEYAASCINVRCNAQKGFKYMGQQGEPNKGEFAKVIYSSGLLVSGISPNILKLQYNNYSYTVSLLRNMRNLGLISEDLSDLDDILESDAFKLCFSQNPVNLNKELGFISLNNIDKDIELYPWDIVSLYSRLPEFLGGLDPNINLNTRSFTNEYGWKKLLAFFINLKIASLGFRYSIPKYINKNIDTTVFESVEDQEDIWSVYSDVVSTRISYYDNTYLELLNVCNITGTDISKTRLFHLIMKDNIFSLIKENFENNFIVNSDFLKSVSFQVGIEATISYLQSLGSAQDLFNILQKDYRDLNDRDLYDFNTLLNDLETHKFRKNRSSSVDSIIQQIMVKAFILVANDDELEPDLTQSELPTDESCVVEDFDLEFSEDALFNFEEEFDF